MEKNSDFMREEIQFQDSILTHTIINLKKHRENMSLINLENFDEIWFTGSGDSHCASLFGAALCRYLGIRSIAFTPMDLSYFTSFSKIKNPLLIAISVSGKTPRVIEVIRRFKLKFSNPSVIGITDNPKSLLYSECTLPILIEASPPESLEYSEYNNKLAKQYNGYHHDVAQTKTYFANILKIIILLLSNDKDKIKLDSISLLKMNFKHSIKNIEDLVLNNEIKYPKRTIFVSSGISRSLAQFSQYKWFEFTLPGLEQDMEEYAHTEYFITDQQSTIVFIAPNGPILTRAKELIEGALGELIKPQILLLTDVDIPEYKKYSTLTVLKLINSKYNSSKDFRSIEFYFYALICLEWYTYHTARKLGFNTNTFRGGVEVEKYVGGSLITIRKSEIKYDKI